jgi:hypothetical protein
MSAGSTGRAALSAGREPSFADLLAIPSAAAAPGVSDGASVHLPRALALATPPASLSAEMAVSPRKRARKCAAPLRAAAAEGELPVLLLLGGGEQADSEDQTAALAHCMPPRKAPRRANGRRACACPIATLPRLSVRMPARAACLRWAACMPWMGAATSPLWLRCTHALPRPRPLPPEQVPVSTRAAGRSVWPARQLLEWTDVRLSSKPFLRPMLYRSTAGS